MSKVFSDFINYPGKPGLKDHYEKLDFLNQEELVLINQYFQELQLEAAATRSEQGQKSIAAAYRSSRVGWIPQQQTYSWLYKKLGDLVNEANQSLWNFDLFGMAEDVQLTEYWAEDQGHYDWHTDVGSGKTSLRKISITIQVSAPEDYTGGTLQFLSRRKPQNAQKVAGAAYVFPSYLLHRVSPIESGVRRSIVVWVSGPPFR